MRVTVFDQCTGQNNLINPESVPFGEKGISFLEASQDVLVSKFGKIVGCRSGSSVASGSFHSLYPCTGGFYAVKERTSDAAIYKVTPAPNGTVTMTGVRDGLVKGAMVDYVMVGADCYYLNGFQCGVLNNETSRAWPVSLWPGPETTADMIPLPIGQHIDVLSGRILTTKDDEIFFSEFALPGLMDRTRNNWRMESRIRMICSVQTGVYVSDERAIYFLQGVDPNTWQAKKVLDYPAIEWERDPGLINPSDHGIESYAMSALFGTVEGPVVGLPDGTPINLINSNLKLPGCSTTGSILVVDKTMILQEV